MTIHSEHPFLPPEDERSPLRRFRGRLAAPVTVWTAQAEGRRPAGLTVSSVVVADGEPGEVIGLIGEDSDLADAIGASGRFTVSILAAQHRALADTLAGLLPAPGGAFASGDWTPTAWGPVPSDAIAWLGARLVGEPESAGWSLLVRGQVEEVMIGPDVDALAYRRGRYGQFRT